MQVVRSYNLALPSNEEKLDTARYTYQRHLSYVNLWGGKLLFNGNKAISTEGLGQLANQAQHKSRGIIRAMRAAAKETGNKVNVPNVKRVGCPAKIHTSRNSFDYWLSVENEFRKNGRIFMPVKSHRKMNAALRDGWTLGEACEFFRDKNGKFYARVFVKKEVVKAAPQAKALGVDVGYTNCVARSDGYIGRNTGRDIARIRAKNRERWRQKHFTKPAKSFLKQQLDLEAKRVIARCGRASWSLAVESPKTLANLRAGGLQGWARSYFAHRCRTLGQESGVFVVDVNPAYTSITCSGCGKIDKQSREKRTFSCTACKSVLSADVNAALNISRKGSAILNNFIQKSGAVSGHGASL